MKVQSLVTTVKLDKAGAPVATPPGVVDLPEDEALALIARGSAKHLEEEAGEKPAKAGKSGKGKAKADAEAEEAEAEGEADPAGDAGAQ